MIDEVHERDHQSDFLLILIRDILPNHPNLKVILMSATLHKELFLEYFNNCPSFHIEGRTFPVTEYFLEDILSGLKGKTIPNLAHIQKIPKVCLRNKTKKWLGVVLCARKTKYGAFH